MVYSAPLGEDSPRNSNHMKLKRWHTFLIGFLLSALFLYFAYRQADFGRIAGIFRTARYEYVIVSALLVLLTTYVRGVRWSVLTEGRLGAVDAFWLFNIGFLFNNVLPARIGEIARAMLTGRRPNMHFTSALSSIVVERLFDMVSVVALLVIVLFALPLPTWATSAGAIMGIGASAGIVFLALASRYPEWALEFGSTVMAMVPRISKDSARGFLSPFVDGLGAVSSFRAFGLGMLLSFLSWVISGFVSWLLMLAFWDTVPVMVGHLAVVAAGMGIAVPAAPGGLGPFEAAIVGVLTAIKYDADISRSYAFALHGINIIMTSLLGILGLFREGVSFGQVAREAQQLKGSSQENRARESAD